MGANPQQTLQAFREAEAYEGPSLILAYSHCIAHGFDLRYGLSQQDSAVAERLLAAAPLRPGDARRSARRRSASTLRGRRCRSRTTPITNCATARWRSAARRRRRRCSNRPQQRRRREIPRLRGVRAHGRGPDARGASDRGQRRLREDETMDLTTRYLGLTLRSPMVASAEPAQRHARQRPRDWRISAPAAVVLPSIFEEQIEREQEVLDALMTTGIDSFGEALTLFSRRCRLRARARALSRDDRAGARKPSTSRSSPASTAPPIGAGSTMPRQLEQAGAAAIGTQRLFHPVRPDAVRPRRREALSRHLSRR